MLKTNARLNTCNETTTSEEQPSNLGQRAGLGFDSWGSGFGGLGLVSTKVDIGGHAVGAPESLSKDGDVAASSCPSSEGSVAVAGDGGGEVGSSRGAERVTAPVPQDSR